MLFILHLSFSRRNLNTRLFQSKGIKILKGKNYKIFKRLVSCLNRQGLKLFDLVVNKDLSFVFLSFFQRVCEREREAW